MRAIDLLGDGWAFLVLREAFFAIRRFDQMATQIQAPRAVLADRLDRLVSNGLLDRVRYQVRPERFEYRLTAKSRDLYPAIVLMMNWGDRWLQSGEPPRRLIHRSCGATLVAKVICSVCRRDVHARTVRQEPGPGIIGAMPNPAERLRRPSDEGIYCRGRACSVAKTLSVVGNRWSVLTLREAMGGARRFDQFQARTGLPTPTLTSRLRLFVEKGVLERVQYQERPLRYEYRLTPMGHDLYGISIALLSWGDRWTAPSNSRPILLRHNACGQPFTPTVVCSTCAVPFGAEDVIVQETSKASAISDTDG